MKIPLEADLSAWMDKDSLSVFLYLMQEQSDPLEFKIQYSEILQNIVESHYLHSANKLHEDGITELEELKRTLAGLIFEIDNLINQHKGN